MRALVTGSAGFLGRHFAAALLARGYEVASVDVLPSPGSQLLPLDALAVFRNGTEVYDLVVHCAAVEPHRAAIDGRPAHLAANLHLDSAMFEWALRTGQRRVLYLSSSAAYPVDLQSGRVEDPTVTQMLPTLSEDAIRAEDPQLPDAGYGWLKLTAERMAADLGRSIPVHVVRPFSGYGEDQGPNWPFGAFLARARRREDPFVVWGDGRQVRDWIHVSDVVAGALAVVDADERRPVNLCTGVGTSMNELVRMACAAAGYAPRIEHDLTKPTGVSWRVGDPERLHQIYKPQVSLQGVLGRVDWGT